MASFTNSNDEESPALALSLSLLSSDDFDEQIAQLPPKGSASTNYISRPCTPTSDAKDDLALALRLSRLSSDDLDPQVTQLHGTGSAAAS
jgi:hypothetical protein